jgi:hypothetical protein
MDGNNDTKDVKIFWQDIGGETIFDDRKGALIEGFDMFLVPKISE